MILGLIAAGLTLAILIGGASKKDTKPDDALDGPPDSFSQSVAAAIASGDIAALELLLSQAIIKGWSDVVISLKNEIGRLKAGGTPAPTPKKPKPAPAPAPTPTGARLISMALKSRGPDVSEWQKILKGNWQSAITVDGIFGPETDKYTRRWQGLYGLKVDGIVGPLTWASAGKKPPAVAPAPAPAPAPAKRAPTLATAPAPAPALAPGGSPLTWSPVAAYTSPPVAAPVDAPVEAPGREAARTLTDYLRSIGGLAGRYREDASRVKAGQGALGTTADGKYGRSDARAIMLHGLIPVAPYYWPRTGTAAAKAEFRALVKTYSDADPARVTEWAALDADTIRS